MRSEAHAPADVKRRLLAPPPSIALIERLLELLPRRRIRVDLQPVQQVQVVCEAQGEWRATGEAPTLRMRTGTHLAPGWYYLEMALVRHNGSREGRLVVHGRGGDTVVPVPSILRGSIREVFRVTDAAGGVDWLPTAAPGLFRQSPILLHRIGGLESALRRAYRVVADLRRFGRTTAATVGLTWRQVLCDLDAAYAASARLRLERARGGYEAFLARTAKGGREGMRQLRKRIGSMPERPLVSLVLPLRHADPAFLGQTLASVSAQIYPEWELLVVVGPETQAAAREFAAQAAAHDPRVRLVPSSSRCCEPAALLNEGVAAARGEWVQRLDAHDLLPPEALYVLVAEALRHPAASLVYGDHDDITAAGRRTAPRFKPDWNPELLQSHDYLGQPVAWRRGALAALGGFAERFGGAENHELALRFLRECPRAEVRHVHHIVYHRRSPAADVPPAETAHEAGRRALQAHFAGTGAEVLDGAQPTLYRVRHPIPHPAPLVTVIVPTRDRLAMLQACVESVRQRTDYPAWEFIVVDNGSIEPQTHSYLRALEADARFRVLRRAGPFNFSALNNFAVEHARGEVLVLLNNDIEAIGPGWLAELVSHAIRPGVGAVGAKLLYPDGTVQHAGVVLGIGGVAGHAHRFFAADAPGYCNRAILTQALSAVTGACLAVRRELYLQVGGMDAEHLAVAFNDIDFCLKLLDAGYRNIFTPWALLYHHESASRGSDDTVEKQAIFRREFDHMRARWADWLDAEPAYNRNLTLEVENFSVKT